MDFLKKLDIQKNNYGSSTGQKWYKSKSGGEIKVHSPVDRKTSGWLHVSQIPS